MKPLQLLALSGSLRRASHNTIALNAIKRLAGDGVNITIGNIGELPLFNPDIEGDDIPPFEQLRYAMQSADGLIISSPEYARGISGVMKNALDWLVSGEEFINIPLMLINTSPRASCAQESLRVVLRTMSGNIIEEASIMIPLLGTQLQADDVLADEALSLALSNGLDIFVREILEMGNTVIE